MGEYDATSHAAIWSLAELPKGEKGTVELTAIRSNRTANFSS